MSPLPLYGGELEWGRIRSLKMCVGLAIGTEPEKSKTGGMVYRE